MKGKEGEIKYAYTQDITVEGNMRSVRNT